MPPNELSMVRQGSSMKNVEEDDLRIRRHNSILVSTGKTDHHGYKIMVNKTGQKIKHELQFLYRMAEEAKEENQYLNENYTKEGQPRVIFTKAKESTSH